MNLLFAKLKRPKLTPFNLEKVKTVISDGIIKFVVTMSVGQWDFFLEEAYYRQGALLLELDENEQLVAAYKYVEKSNKKAC